MITLRDGKGRQARVDARHVAGRLVIPAGQFTRATSGMTGEVRAPFAEMPVGVLRPDGQVGKWLPTREEDE